MSDLANLKQKRSAIKSKVTRNVNYVNNLDSNVNAEIAESLKYRLQRVEPLYDEFEKLQSEIEVLASEPDDNEWELFERNYFELLGKIKSLLNTYNDDNFELQSVVSNDTNVANVETRLNGVEVNDSRFYNQNIKLPTIKLPTFDGQYSKWLEFRDAFKALVHNNSNISNIQKFYYLKSALENEAESTITSIEVSDDNYSIAWQLLVDRFENKSLIVHNHVKAIFEVQHIGKESHNELRNLFDNISKHLRSLKSLGQPTEQWDTLIIHILASKFDTTTRRDWESFIYSGELPTMVDMNKFLKNKCDVLEKLEFNKNSSQQNQYGKKPFIKFDNKLKFGKDKTVTNTSLATNKIVCYYCKKDHAIYNCDQFKALGVNDKIAQVKQLNLCLNCLRHGHTVAHCTFSHCKFCTKRHNSLLHIPKESIHNADANTTQSSSQSNPCVNDVQISSSLHAIDIKNNAQVLLSTVNVKIKDSLGKYQLCRALLDNGSQSCFITENLCNKLKLPKSKINFAVSGVGQCMSNVEFQTVVHMKSLYNSYNISIPCLVINKITEPLPINSVSNDNFYIPEGIELADVNFNVTSNVDLLLGANIFWQILSVGRIRIENSNLSLQKTLLGWLVVGTAQASVKNKIVTCFSTCSQTGDFLNDQLQKFWLLEECENKNTHLSESEIYCENHFLDNFTRDHTGRFVVRIPFKDNIHELGDTREIALNRFRSLENKLLKDSELRSEYIHFMNEYITLGHMSEMNGQGHSQDDKISLFLPHHPVIKNTSVTTKVRVVFDGSVKSTTGLSLNDVQHVGPAIQNDLFSIILRFRLYIYVLTADISKMYRQVLVDKKDRSMQTIFWRSNSSEELKCYELNTVTYGTASAPYLAIRCLKQLAVENSHIYPIASNIIHNDFYVDDLLTGANSREELINIQKEVSFILASGGFPLRKWLCNDSNILKQFELIPNLDVGVLQLGPNEKNKTLGVLWNPNSDNIEFSTKLSFNKSTPTKRTVLSVISQIFDPLGLLGPFVIVGKIIIQKLWQANINWDDELPDHLLVIWKGFEDDIHNLENIEIPRRVLETNTSEIQLHGFADASEVAYGACVYIRCTVNGNHFTNLLCAKSRVAPLKSTTLPRLELCAAHLLSELVHRVIKSANIIFSKTILWSDSTIALSWIKGTPSRWKTFVANRVSAIQILTSQMKWCHVKSGDNPADLLSRGVNSNTLMKSKLWWTGPEWLSTDHWPPNELVSDDENIPETKSVNLVSTTISNFQLFSRFSSLNKLKNTMAYVHRFISNCQRPKQDRQLGNLTTEELSNSFHSLLKLAQQESFSSDYACLVKKGTVPRKSKILSLNPFLDTENLIRVGGRLQNTEYEINRKHPYLLHNKHPLTRLILENEHRRLDHCGPQQLLCSVRETFWPISGRNSCRSIVRKCMTCFRAKPYNTQYIMANLPTYRVNQYTPFYNTGLDYAGPFLIKNRNARNAKTSKCYVCLFVCMCTKAVHLELVTDLTTESFLNTFKRFVSRRSLPANLYSDNAKTFIGANSYLKELFQFLQSNTDIIAAELAKFQVSWHFIPARSPNFGGIWEAGVKSLKHHMKRVIGNCVLTFESLYTVLTGIESILNSRPLSPLSCDPSDLNPLTPAHLLIGKSLTSLPEQNLLPLPKNRLSQYQFLEQIKQHFWKRWQKEYISELQTRTKWKTTNSSRLAIGKMVVIKDDNLPPLKWSLGRVNELHPGADGVVRVVSIKTAGGVVTRAVSKICELPVE